MASDEGLHERIYRICQERVRQHPACEIAAQYLDQITQGVYDRLEGERDKRGDDDLTFRKRLFHYIDWEIDHAIDLDGKTGGENDLLRSIDDVFEEEPPTLLPEPEGKPGARGADYAPALSVRSRFMCWYKRLVRQAELLRSARPTRTDAIGDLEVLQRACDPDDDRTIWLRFEYEIDRLRTSDPDMRILPIDQPWLGAMYSRIIKDLAGPASADSDVVFLAELGIRGYDPRVALVDVKTAAMWQDRMAVNDGKPRKRRL